VGNPLLDPHRSQSQVVAEWFNTAAFAMPAAGTDGNAGRNILDGHGSRDIDQRFQYGQPHHPQLRAGDHCERQSGRDEFGAVWQIRNAADMRQVQLELRPPF
jgi:hypothetical protein